MKQKNERDSKKKLLVFRAHQGTCIACVGDVQIFFQQIKERKLINIQDDREFEALSESIVAFSKKVFAPE